MRIKEEHYLVSRKALKGSHHIYFTTVFRLESGGYRTIKFKLPVEDYKRVSHYAKQAFTVIKNSRKISANGDVDFIIDNLKSLIILHFIDKLFEVGASNNKYLKIENESSFKDEIITNIPYEVRLLLSKGLYNKDNELEIKLISIDESDTYEE